MDIDATKVVLEGKVWETELPELGDLEVLVAPWENAAFERAMSKAIGALPPAMRAGGKIDPIAFARIQGEVMSKTILFGWRNFTAAGTAVEWSAEVAKKYLTDPKFRVLRDGVVVAARRVQAGITADEEAALGNSPKSSPGSESGDLTPGG
jgi:hypothetical protein